ncbi:ferritin-like domain-containing protein [Hymenobacter properus]|uniref:Ferritin-like domain-containing protein n=1 Tax=Hymenobacter properus TaxID=2791026 RepID=A0A931FHT7_9BACT|nr:ferritin-like domain-containing protein [Hymenobacter properus]MBF9141387.1 ferritin-like domain-containing protein [Hymenobacter properus]MBR7720196.1 ferritin-like domain-containing protein [Microvirga sp. SRT04]
MKLISLLDHLAATPASSAAAPRRDVLAQLGRAAAAALPLALGTLPAAAATNDTPLDALLQLLQLERLQAALYTQGLAATGLIPAGQTADFQRLLAHQNQHVAFLTRTLQDAGSAAPTAPTFDFSGRRNVASNPELFPAVFSNYDNFLALAQQIEDLGVRLYQYQAFNINSDTRLTQAVLRMQSVEAQHSAHVRSLRRGRGATVGTWPSDEDATIVRPAAQALTTAATGGEANVVQFASASTQVPFSTFFLIRDNTAIHDPALAEAFDEPITSAVGQAALNLFS